jgi:Fe-S-cluster containining protein
MNQSGGISPDRPQSTDVRDLESQVVRGSLFMHSALSEEGERITELETMLFGLVDHLVAAGVTTREAVTHAGERARTELEERGDVPAPGVALRVDGTDDHFVPVNCAERIHVCKAVCCRLAFALSAEEVGAGNVKWDLGSPYQIRQRPDGYCNHNDAATHACTLYDDRPGVCRRYSCANDARIWSDFEKMQLNDAWIDEHLAGTRPRLLTALMMIPAAETATM